jgi:hypothetical protein
VSLSILETHPLFEESLQEHYSKTIPFLNNSAKEFATLTLPFFGI